MKEPKDNRVIIDLEYPIEVDGVEVHSLSMRRPTLRDEVAFADGKGGQGQKLLRMLASLTGVSPDDLMNLDGSDSDRLMRIYTEMKGIETGDTDPLG